MISKKLLCASLGAVALAGCASATYEEPAHVETNKRNEVLLDKSYDAVWNSLIQYSASTFFAIKNYEKDSGLITLEFGASNPEDFVTGGYWKNSGFEGEYVQYLSDSFNGQLNGLMNIVVAETDNQKTKVIVNARYVFTTPNTKNALGNTWVFDSGSCDRVRVHNAAMGIQDTRTLCPTYKAEETIINALK